MSAPASLDEIVGRLRDAYEPERIYQLGSAARGDMHSDSDYDLMVVVGDSAPPESAAAAWPTKRCVARRLLRTWWL